MTLLLLLLIAFALVGVLLPFADAGRAQQQEQDCICGPLPERPDVLDHLGVARWLVHSLNMGVLSTISTKDGPTAGAPFGNIYSFVDGPCQVSTGIPYFYVSPLDQSAKDATINTRVSFALTEAFLPGTCQAFSQPPACDTAMRGDPENPVCARLVISGQWIVLDSETEKHEYTLAQKGLWQRHPVMQEWPTDHKWQIVRLDVDDLWFLDFYGGAYQLNVQDYLALPWPLTAQK